jgi:acyl-coenzyme A thioesterase PaaI-like protein
MNILSLYNRFKNIPVGKNIFSKLVCFNAPYFSSIKPLVVELKPGLAKVKIKKRRAVQNHIKTVHAIAMCNMAELAGGLMTDVSIPKGCRWIPKGMKVEYLQKAKTDLTAIADGKDINWNEKGDVTVPVEVFDIDNQKVFHADITMYIS